MITVLSVCRFLIHWKPFSIFPVVSSLVVLEGTSQPSFRSSISRFTSFGCYSGSTSGSSELRSTTDRG
jgi:hypothetical protein